MDLNDLYYFTLIVEHGGFSAAARHAPITKSKLSRRIATLEEQIGARLLQRSTRKLTPTEAGRVLYEHGRAMMVEAEAARDALEQMKAEPSGTVRMTCPSALAQGTVTGLITKFMRLHPKVRVELDSSDRTLDIIEERIDIALRARDSGLTLPGLVARRIASGSFVLVASPDYVARRSAPETPSDLTRHDTIGSLREGEEQGWTLTARDGRIERVTVRPRFLCSDYTVQYQSALGGVGVAFLPSRVVWRALEEGRLVRVAGHWGTPEQGIHLVFASRRGMLPSVRAMIDFLMKEIPAALAEPAQDALSGS